MEQINSVMYLLRSLLVIYNARVLCRGNYFLLFYFAKKESRNQVWHKYTTENELFQFYSFHFTDRDKRQTYQFLTMDVVTFLFVIKMSNFPVCK